MVTRRLILINQSLVCPKVPSPSSHSPALEGIQLVDLETKIRGGILDGNYAAEYS